MTTYPRFAVLVLALLALAASACQLPVFFPEFVVNTSDPSDTESGDVAIGEDGDFVVTWQEYDDNVLGRRFDRLAAPLGDPFPVNAATTNAQDESSIAMDAQGRFVAVWMEDAQTIWGRRFDADGTPLSGDFQVNTSTPMLAAFPHVASDPSGNFVVAWTAASAADPEVDGPAFRQQRDTPRRRVPGELVLDRLSGSRRRGDVAGRLRRQLGRRRFREHQWHLRAAIRLRRQPGDR